MNLVGFRYDWHGLIVNMKPHDNSFTHDENDEILQLMTKRNYTE